MTKRLTDEDIVEMQQVGAYPTKHEPFQKRVPLLEENEQSDNTKKREET